MIKREEGLEMAAKNNVQKEGKKKSFIAAFLEKLDKKMAEKVKSQSCCKPANKDSNSCCS